MLKIKYHSIKEKKNFSKKTENKKTITPKRITPYRSKIKVASARKQLTYK